MFLVFHGSIPRERKIAIRVGFFSSGSHSRASLLKQESRIFDLEQQSSQLGREMRLDGVLVEPGSICEFALVGKRCRVDILSGRETFEVDPLPERGVFSYGA